jgi:tRNA uridine 5-carboxymethylaminomethyl modification enzyme
MAAGCVGEARRVAFARKMEALGHARGVAESVRVSPTAAAGLGLAVNQDGVRRSLFELMGAPEIGLEPLRERFGELGAFDRETLRQLEREARYAPYLARQRQEVELVRRDEAVSLPRALDYRAMPGLSAELREKLARVRPETLGQAARIEGVTPAALTLLLMRARQEQARASS